MNNFLFLLLLFLCQQTVAQDNPSLLHFQLQYQQAALVLGESYTRDGEEIIIDNVQFYVSNVRFYKNGELLQATIPQHILVNAGYDTTAMIKYAFAGAYDFDQLTFNIGIDSITNLSGAYGGALDPTQGMYWTWQNGYINVKLEGSASNCPARKNRFQYHLGGYAHPNNSLQSVRVKVKNAAVIQIYVDIEKFLEQIDMSKTYEVMSPNAEAVFLSKRFSTIFSSGTN